MKVVRIHDHLHLALKIESAKTGKSVESIASGCVSHCLKMLKAGKLEIPALDAAEKRNAAKQ